MLGYRAETWWSPRLSAFQQTPIQPQTRLTSSPTNLACTDPSPAAIHLYLHLQYMLKDVFPPAVACIHSNNHQYSTNTITSDGIPLFTKPFNPFHPVDMLASHGHSYMSHIPIPQLTCIPPKAKHGESWQWVKVNLSAYPITTGKPIQYQHHLLQSIFSL